MKHILTVVLVVKDKINMEATKNNTDYLDAYCEAELGHTNWAFTHSVIDVHLTGNADNYHSAVIFYKKPEKEE